MKLSRGTENDIVTLPELLQANDEWKSEGAKKDMNELYIAFAALGIIVEVNAKNQIRGYRSRHLV